MDIVERLREWKDSPLFNAADLDPSDMEEAADEIERLRQLNERFGKALQKIAISRTDEGAWKIAYETIMRTMWGE